MEEPSSPTSVKSGKTAKSGKSGRTRSKSPSKFSANAFDKRKGKLASVRGSAASIAKLRGLKLDLSELSNKEVLATFAQIGTFAPLDRKTGAGATLYIEGKKLLAEDINITTEILKRNSEVQVISLVQCSINDTMLEQMSTEMKQLRHLKKLILTQNLLTVTSTSILIKIFAKAPRKLEIMDLRGNNLTFEDGFAVCNSFFPSIKSLSGIEIGKFKEDKKMTKLTLIQEGLKEAELGMICSFIGEMIKYHYQDITTLNLRRNMINARALQKFIDFLREPFGRNVTEIDFSENPLSNDCTNLTALESLVEYGANCKQLLKITLDRIDGFTPEQMVKLQRSSMVNRSVKGSQDHDNFKTFITKYVEEKMKNLYDLPDEIEGLDIHAVDVQFVKDNRLDLATVEMRGDGNNYKLNRRHSQAVPKPIGF